jgi:hypothetical protein
MRSWVKTWYSGDTGLYTWNKPSDPEAFKVYFSLNFNKGAVMNAINKPADDPNYRKIFVSASRERPQQY